MLETNLIFEQQLQAYVEVENFLLTALSRKSDNVWTLDSSIKKYFKDVLN